MRRRAWYDRLADGFFGVCFALFKVIAFVPAMIYLGRTAVAVHVYLMDLKEHGIREIMRALPGHNRGVIMALLNNATERGIAIQRGFYAGRRYRLPPVKKRPRRARTAEKPWWDGQQIGGTAWAR
jgi:hypothetical protein